MAASALLTFDTTAPVVELDSPQVAGPDSLRVPFALDEPASVEAEVSIVGGGALPAVVGADDVMVSGLPVGNYIIHVSVTAVDDVLNQATYERDYPIVWSGQFIKRAWVYPIGGVEVQSTGLTGGRDTNRLTGGASDDALTGGNQVEFKSGGVARGDGRLTNGTSEK